MKSAIKLFIRGKGSESEKVIDNLRSVIDNDGLRDPYALVVIDALENPELVELERVVATPTLIKQLPPPISRQIGQCSNEGSVLMGLNLTTKNGRANGKR